MLKTLMVRSTLVALVSSIAFTAYAMADAPKRIDVPAGKLVVALETLSRQAAVDLVFQPDQLKSFHTGGVRGTYSPQDAIRILLQGTPLQLRTDASSGAMVIAPAPSAPKSTAIGSSESQPSSKSLWSGLRLAQTDTPSPSPPQGQGEVTTGEDEKKAQSPKVTELEEIVVTGSHIRGVEPSSSPLIVFNRADIERSGATTVDQFMRTVPQNVANVEPFSNFGVSGDDAVGANQTRGAAINLRGLGPGATLVLINGHRVSPSGQNGDQVDVSLIPLAAVERIDILTDGASALYGSDAVAGVVNFVLRDNFDGAQTALRYGGTTQGGGRERGVGQVLGTSWDTGSGVLSYEYLDQDAIRVSQRDFLIPNPQNFLPDSTILAPQTRQSILATGKQKLGAGTQLFADAIFSRRDYEFSQDTVTRLANSEGQSRNLNAAAGLRQELPGSWSADFTYVYSDIDAENKSLTTNAISTLDTRMQSIDALVGGALLSMPGGELRMSLGAQYRDEKLSNALLGAGREIDRSVTSGFAELFVPFFSSRNAVSFVDRLELSAAVRHDDYSDFGSNIDSKFGLLWSPLAGLNLRATHATSFRAPALGQVHPLGQSGAVTRIPAPGGQRAVIARTGSNTALDPETSSSFTAGFDVSPVSLPDFRVSTSYYRIKYRDRIGTPPGSFAVAFTQPQVWSAFVNANPTAAEVAALYALPNFANGANIPASAILAIVDIRLLNIRDSEQKGIDFAADYQWKSGIGDFTGAVSGQYVIANTFQASSTTPELSLVDQIFQPTRWRFGGNVGWSRGPLSSFLFVNYVDRYQNTAVAPFSDISSWTTVDLSIGYRGTSDTFALLRDTSLTLYVQNLLDKDPPATGVLRGFDPINASLRGRSLSLMLARRW